MAKTISFTQQVKEEIVSNDYESIDRLKALLSAYVRINGRLGLHQRESAILLYTENAKIAKFLYTSFVNTYGVATHIDYEQKNNIRRRTLYEVVVEEDVDNILSDLSIDFFETKITHKTIKNDDMISGYLAGAFLASGSVNSPSTSNYHLEFCLNDENYAKWFLHLFSRYKNTNIQPKIIKRRDKYVVYFKKSDLIAEFLVMIGAVNSCMEFENIRIDRDFTNTANRLANFDTANMKKTVAAAQKQVQQIEMIDQVMGIQNITNNKMRTLCELRLEFESASLNELAEMMSERLNVNITRSNVSHLFTSIERLYFKVIG